MSYYYHLEENEIQKIQTGSKNKWYIQALQARKMQLQELVKLLECADKNNLWKEKEKKGTLIMKLIRILLAHKCVKAMKHRYRDKEHQLMKIREEEQELAEAVDREITREELRIIETMKDDNCFKYAYRLYVKNTKAEERADCFIAWAGMLSTAYPRRRTYLMQAKYCTSWEDVKHILMKLRYNKVRDDWT